MEVTLMRKSKINVTLDQDLIEYAKLYAEEQRTSVSEIFTQFLLNLKRTKEGDPTQIILADPDFKESLLKTISKIKSGKIKWLKYKEVF
jgi:16S rRNA G966 N2-methylase RsmD